jgi:16S rRNA (guanine1207-N2)-methyltransferase
MGEPSHYFAPQPEAPSAPRPVELVLPDLRLTLMADRGVFSHGQIDPGTMVLLLEAGRPPDEPVDLLDLGCGYGPIALALAARAPKARVWAIDVNERALALCQANAAAAGLDNVRVVHPEAVPDDVSLAGIWSNPPVRIGKPALHALLDEWLGRLTPDGRAWLVVHKHLGSDSLARWLGGRGHTVTRTASRAGYRVLEIRTA